MFSFWVKNENYCRYSGAPLKQFELAFLIPTLTFPLTKPSNSIFALEKSQIRVKITCYCSIVPYYQGKTDKRGRATFGPWTPPKKSAFGAFLIFLIPNLKHLEKMDEIPLFKSFS